MKISIFQSILVSSLIIILSVNSFADEGAGSKVEQQWPKEINNAGGELTIYQPQLESLKKNKVIFRAAVSVKLNGEKEPIFGAVWLTSRLSTDRETRMATLEDIKVNRIKFPDGYKDKLESLTSIIKSGFLNKDIEISLDRLHAMLEFAEKEEAVSKDFIMKPPEIIFTTNPAVLVSIDGEPKLQPVKGKKLMRVINATYTILLDTETKKYYLGSGKNWVSASDILGDWAPVTEIPDEVKSFDAGGREVAEKNVDRGGVLPEVIVKTNVAELIVIEGNPGFVPIRGTGLLYVENTKANVFLKINPQKIYLLLSGRWYASSKKKGPWENVPSDKLPADFAKISPGSVKGEVLTHVSGTEESKDAVLDSYIPQTARIDRDDTNIVVAFDGEPEFEEIEGTEMEYAVNTEDQVIYVDNKYYCCKSGIWYVTDKLLTIKEKVTGNVENVPSGSDAGAVDIYDAVLNLSYGTIWSVCSIVPPVIYTIPPSCPAYPVTYCRVYDDTPEDVYVGYTPGYEGSYCYDDRMVYGTGYGYTPWLGSYYWPRPCTFGLSANYNDITGWNVGLGYGAVYGGIAVGRTAGAVAWHRNRGYGYGRGGGHNNIYVNNSRNYKNERNINNNRRDYDRSTGNRPLPSTGNRPLPSTGNQPLPSTGNRPLPSTGNQPLPSTGNRPLPSTGNRPLPSTGDRPLPSTGNRPLPSTGNRELPSQGRSSGSLQDISSKGTTGYKASSKRNNVYADKSGNISRRSLDGWQTKGKSGWSSSNHSSQSRRSMDNQHKARQRGTTNTRNYQQSRSSTSRSSSNSSKSRSATNHLRSRSSRSSGRSSRGGGRSRGGRR